jgi:hypothetical protein
MVLDHLVESSMTAFSLAPEVLGARRVKEVMALMAGSWMSVDRMLEPWRGGSQQLSDVQQRGWDEEPRKGKNTYD